MTPGNAAPTRFDSVDALRGFVMFMMLYVNDVAGVAGIPAWMKHYPARGNGMTFVDWVFGGFLFVVGLSIPLAFTNRIQRGDRQWKLVLHVLSRTLALLLLGFFMVNGERGPRPDGWPAGLWSTLLYLFSILAFLSPLAPSPKQRAISYSLRALGFAGFVFLAIVFQTPRGGGMKPQWWGILGLIGWAYLAASVIYLVFRTERSWLVACTAILVGLYLFDRGGFFDGDWAKAHLPFLSWARRYVSFGQVFGSHGSITLAGVVLGVMLLDPLLKQPDRLRDALIWGALLIAGALMVYPIDGINKNNATPAWCLICAAITCWLWVLFSGTGASPVFARRLNFFIEGGRNVLLAYLLMPLITGLFALVHFNAYWKIGAISPGLGILRALVMAALVLWLSAWLNRHRIRLRL